MRHIRNQIVVLTVATIVFGINVFGQSTALSKSDFLGTVDGREYTNPYFGFKLKVPADFSIMASAEATLVSNAGGDMLKNEGSKSKDIDAALARQATLIGVTQKPMGSFPNAAFEIVVSKQQKGVTASMALLASVRLLTASPKFKLSKSIPAANFGGQQFVGAVIDGEVNTVTLTQEMYVAMRRGYSMHVVISYSNSEGRNEMMKLMNALKFTK